MTLPTTRILLVGPGATEMTAEDRFSGATGTELSKEGRSQARHLSERLCHLGIAAVYASPLGRALDTARILAKPHDRPVVERADLREIDHGTGKGSRATRSRSASRRSTRRGRPIPSPSRRRTASRA